MGAKYRKIFTLSFSHAFRNVKGLIGLSIFLVTCLLIFAELWKVAASRLGALHFNPQELLWYIAFNEWVLVSLPDVHEGMEEDLRSGKFGYLLPRPISYLAATFFEGLGTLFANLLVLGVVTFAFVWWKAGGCPVSLGPFLISLIVGVFSSCFALLFLMLIGVSAFWVGQVAPFHSVWEKLLLTLGGIMLPLMVYPVWLQKIAHWTPFPLILGDRSLLAIQFNGAAALSFLIRLFLWTGFVLATLALLYRQGLKKVHMEGG